MLNSGMNNRVSKQKKKSPRVSKACNTCRARKIKCNGMKPCASCSQAGIECTFDTSSTHRTTLYKEEDDIRKDLRTLTTCVNTLSKLKSIDPQKLNPVVTELQSKLNVFRNDMRVMLESEKITEYESDRSLETELIDSNFIRFNRFTSSNLEDDDLKQVLDGYFGIYSPLCLLTNQGYGWLFKKLFSSKLDHSDVKMTFYLYLRFFDLSHNISNQASKLHSIPFKAYNEKYMDKNIPYSEQSVVNHIIERACSLLNLTHDKPEFVRSDDPLQILQFMNKHIEHMQHFSYLKGTDPLGLQIFYGVDDLLSTLFRHCESLIFQTRFRDPKVADALLTQLDYANNKEESYHMRDVVSLITDNVIFNGLDRWEYYIGLNEATADQYRSIWWKCIWYDRWAAVSTGKPFLLNENMAQCLLPKKWMSLGLNETMESELLLNTIDFGNKLVDDEVFIDVSRFLLSKLLTTHFKSILYNKDFTDYRVFSSKYPIFEATLHDLLQNIEQLTWNFAKLDEKMEPYVGELIPSNPRFHVYITMRYCRVEVYNTIESVLIRFANSPRVQDKNLINKLILKQRLDIFKLCSSSLQMLSNISTAFDNIKYNKLTTMFFMHTIIYSIDNPTCNMIDTINNVCTIVHNARACSRMGSASVSTKLNNIKEGSNLPVYFTFVLTRIFLQIYIEKRNISEEVLIAEVSKINEQNGNMVKDILDINSSCYSLLMTNIPNSPMHVKVLKDINKVTKTKFMDNFTPPASVSIPNSDTENVETVSTVTDSDKNLEIFTTLDDFLQLNAFSEIYEALWGELDDSSPDIKENINCN
ncbi:similar to Saccharomyces cerevisiae YER184C Putative zinc cluster protein [Maudiozyma saulgeensis]|uniref:Similar to Saccharomyces cerevisiae YER184C Putative zinc cluster protein n=1 Tax=Maudiozyma saulgeensis TaxID=1789683 RepID=A0A1X7R6T2_9SACH|nr:similar to Saccharomyces cerevisiae YER184C Putative zinc cluster protein [Kazachstania saulgeensis]